MLYTSIYWDIFKQTTNSIKTILTGITIHFLLANKQKITILAKQDDPVRTVLISIYFSSSSYSPSSFNQFHVFSLISHDNTVLNFTWSQFFSLPTFSPPSLFSCVLLFIYTLPHLHKAQLLVDSDVGPKMSIRGTT